MTNTDPNAPLMNGAEFALLRYELGLSLSQVAKFLDVNPRTVRAWNADRDPIPDGVVLELDDLVHAHLLDVEDAVALGHLDVPYGSGDVVWWLSVAAAARRRDPALVVRWDSENDPAN